MHLNTKLAILGGSSPFTAALFDAVASAECELRPMELVLHGRNETDLAVVGQYARRCLTRRGWTVRWTQSIAEALDGAAIVLHQNRYGGLEGRAAGERLCARVGVAADETLGAAALLTGMLCVNSCNRLEHEWRRYCPDAWLLNLTNPMSCVTALFAKFGVRRCLGLCELPIVTAHAVARILNVPLDRISWEYSGLNHRGFLHDIRIDGEDVFPEVLARLGANEFCAVQARSIADLQAVPLKYFRLIGQPVESAGRSRAGELARLRIRLIAELAQAGDSPPSLRARNLDWYPLAVVPCLTALQSTRPRMVVVNLPGSDGCVREMKAALHQGEVEPMPSPPPRGLAGDWLRRFEVHERAAMTALLNPTPQTIEDALAADPLVPQTKLPMAASAVWTTFCRQLRENRPLLGDSELAGVG
jgi:6-phospho-beta-glucosidase